MPVEPINESGLVRRIITAIQIEHPGCWVLKAHGGPFQQVGVPDLLLCVEGLFIGLEVKHQKPGESLQHALDRATPGQLHQINLINHAGGVGGVVTSVDEALETIRMGLENRVARR